MNLKSNEEVLSELDDIYFAKGWNVRSHHELEKKLKDFILDLRKADMEAVRGIAKELKAENKRTEKWSDDYYIALSDFLQQLPNK